MKAKTKLALFFLVCILMGAGFLLNTIRLICPLGLIAGSESSPVVTRRESDFLPTYISQIVSDKNHVYVLFGNYSVVQVYSPDGSYQYSISVYNHMNGRTELAAHGNHLYICDKVGNVYIFENDTLIQFIERNDISELSPAILFGGSDPNYSVQGSSVWLTPDGGAPHLLIERPAWLTIYQNDSLTVILFALAVLGGAILLVPQKAKKPTAK